MKATAYYANKFPAHLLVKFKGAWYVTKMSPFRTIGEEGLKPLGAPKNYLDTISKSDVCSSIARFYGLD